VRATTSEGDRLQQPAEFDVLQHHVNALDLTLCNMADVVDMTDELDDAEKKAARSIIRRRRTVTPAPTGCWTRS
jgi:hypothetical protein